MSQFIQVLETGLTVRGVVRNAGEVVAVSDDFNIQGKRAQVKRWDKPRYKEISEDEFKSLGGGGVSDDVDPELAAIEADLAAKAEEGQGGITTDESVGGEIIEGPFKDLEGLNVEDTLKAVAEFDEEMLQNFILHEKATENRKGVLEPLGAEAE